jgi:hypothetical protein
VELAPAVVWRLVPAAARGLEAVLGPAAAWRPAQEEEPLVPEMSGCPTARRGQEIQLGHPRTSPAEVGPVWVPVEVGRPLIQDRAASADLVASAAVPASVGPVALAASAALAVRVALAASAVPGALAASVALADPEALAAAQASADLAALVAPAVPVALGASAVPVALDALAASVASAAPAAQVALEVLVPSAASEVSVALVVRAASDRVYGRLSCRGLAQAAESAAAPATGPTGMIVPARVRTT